MWGSDPPVVQGAGLQPIPRESLLGLPSRDPFRDPFRDPWESLLGTLRDSEWDSKGIRNPIPNPFRRESAIPFDFRHYFPSHNYFHLWRSFPLCSSSGFLFATMFLSFSPLFFFCGAPFCYRFPLQASFSPLFSSFGLLFAIIFLFGPPFCHYFHLRASFSQLFSSSGLLVATIVSSSGPLFATIFLSHLKFCISPICFSKRPCQTLREKILLSSPHESWCNLWLPAWLPLAKICISIICFSKCPCQTLWENLLILKAPINPDAICDCYLGVLLPRFVLGKIVSGSAQARPFEKKTLFESPTRIQSNFWLMAWLPHNYFLHFQKYFRQSASQTPWDVCLSLHCPRWVRCNLYPPAWSSHAKHYIFQNHFEHGPFQTLLEIYLWAYGPM